MSAKDGWNLGRVRGLVPSRLRAWILVAVAVGIVTGSESLS
jgi:hypothetical protein